MITWKKGLCKGRQRQEHQQKHKTKWIFAGLLVLLVPPDPSRLFWSFHPPKNPLLQWELRDSMTTISTFSQGLEAKKENKKGADGEASPTVVAGVFFFCLEGSERGICLILEKARFSFCLVDSFPLSPLFIMANISALIL